MPAKQATRVPVLVALPNRTLAEALAVALRQEKDLTVQVATERPEAVAAALRGEPRVVFVDLEVSGEDGVETIHAIKDELPSTAVIALVGREDDLLLARALEAGAAGFVPTWTPVTALPAIARAAAGGERLLEPDEVARLFRLLRRRRHQEATERQRANRLTPRQREILQLMADGVPGGEIAERLGVTRPTLRTHLQNILTRLGVHTKHEALVVAIRHGKISTRR